MIKSIIKWLLQVCFSAILKELTIEYNRKEEITYEKTTNESKEK